MSQTLTFEELLPQENSGTLNELKLGAHKAAFELISDLNKRATKEKWLQICTSESLTAGLIMATLVDIPFGGYLKYGCFGVYDTDAKRVFNGVSVDDVYTHRCAKEMAVGILNNSNATLAIAVTGNAMPLNPDADMLGEVFVGIAGYKGNSIIYETYAINGCNESLSDEFKGVCKTWYETITKMGKYNPRDRTALVSQYIRNYTAIVALDLCLKFVTTHNPDVPDFIIERKKINEMNVDGTHTTIPSNKYNIKLKEICVTEPCVDVITPKRVSTKPIRVEGGRRKRKTHKKRN